MTPEDYLNQQTENRQRVMRALHDTIIMHDKNVEPVVEPMMGKEMIIYKECDYMKYALAGVKNHMSLHCLPMYMKPEIHAQYEKALPNAKFQKGCINFIAAEEMPISIAASLIADCSKINIANMLEKRTKKR